MSDVPICYLCLQFCFPCVCWHFPRVGFIYTSPRSNSRHKTSFLRKRLFSSFFLLQKFYIVFYSSYVSICKDLQKTIVLSSGPFLQIFTFTIQCICNLWWIESSPSEAIPYTQKYDSNKAAAMHLCWNDTTAWVPSDPVNSPHMP